MSEILDSPFPLKLAAQKHLFFDTTSKLNGNFNGLYLQNETKYKIGKYVGNYKGSPTSSQNIMKFGPQMV